MKELTIPHITNDDGNVLLAEYDVAESGRGGFVLTLESHSGRRGAATQRNPDYSEALRLVIRRLATVGATLQDARVDSNRTRHLPVERNRLVLPAPFPIDLGEAHAWDLADAIMRAQRDAGTPLGVRQTGKQNKRIALEVHTGQRLNLRQLLAWISHGAAALADDEAAVEAAVRPQSRASMHLSAAERRAVESRAMHVATADWESRGYIVTDVSSGQSYDLVCQRGDEVVHVEVKGTTGAGASMMVTSNEVEHATYYERTALAIVAGIKLDGDPNAAAVVANDGQLRTVEPWRPYEGQLSAKVYRWAPARS